MSDDDITLVERLLEEQIFYQDSYIIDLRKALDDAGVTPPDDPTSPPQHG